jgi:8-oxo-dGTP pyrophosphatase MutT (NUDIX family)
LRELEEETGIAADRVRILGQIEDHATVTGFLVTPVIGLVTPPIEIRPDPHEVAEVFECPLSFALDPANFRRHTGIRDGRQRHFYELTFEDRRIWGFTARILVRLSGLLWR